MVAEVVKTVAEAGATDVVKLAVYVFSGGAGLGGGLMFFKWLFDFAGARADRRETGLEVGTAQLNQATNDLIRLMQDQIEGQEHRIGDLIARLDHVEHELEECRARDAARLEELVKLRAYMQGTGDAKQDVARMVARDRLTDKRVAELEKGADNEVG